MLGRTKPYEPSPRFGHCATPVGGRCFLWGGRVADSSATGRKKLASTVDIFDPYLEMWEQHATSGVPPPGCWLSTYTSVSDLLYSFGGEDHDGLYYNTLYMLDHTSLEWKDLQVLNQADRPMRKVGCGMVPTVKTDWYCLEATAFPPAQLNLEQHLSRIPAIVMGVVGATSSTFSTSMKICEYFVNSFCSLLDCVLLLHGVYKGTNNLLSEDF